MALFAKRIDTPKYNIESDVDQLAEIKQHIAALEKEAKEITKRVQKSMETYETKKVYTSDGNHYVQLISKINWIYSKKLNKLYDKVKIRRVKEQLSGKASCTYTNYVALKSSCKNEFDMI